MERLIFFIIFLLIPFHLGADKLTEGIEAYNRNDYTTAIEKFGEYLKIEEGNLEGKLLAKSYIGSSYFIMKKEPEATGWFLSLLNEEYEYELNPVYFPPEIIAFYHRVRENVYPLLARKEQVRFWVNLLPFGAGQFQNREYIKGATVASLEVLSLSVNIWSYLLRKSLEENGKYPEEKSAYARKLQNIQLISGGIFIAGYIFGVVDGGINFGKRKEIRLSILQDSDFLSLTYNFNSP